MTDGTVLLLVPDRFLTHLLNYASSKVLNLAGRLFGNRNKLNSGVGMSQHRVHSLVLT
jgi:hypothetical protein